MVNASINTSMDETIEPNCVVDIYLHNFPGLEPNGERALDRTCYTDDWYCAYWTFSLVNLNYGSLSLHAVCDVLCEENESWYNFVDMQISIIPGGPAPDCTRRQVVTIDKEEPRVAFFDIEGLKTLKDPTKGLISESGQLHIRIEFLKHKVFKCSPLNIVPATFWTTKTTAPLKQYTSGEFSRNLFNCTRYSDCQIISSDGQKIPAHKLLLVRECPYFERELFELNKEELDLSPASSKVVLTFLVAIYRHELIIDEKTLIQVHELAMRVSFPDLAELCRIHVTSHMAAQVLCPQSNQTPYTNELLLRARSLMQSHLPMFVEQNLIKDLKKSELENLLNSQDLSISEHTLWLELEKWVEAECVRQKKIATSEAAREILGDLKYLIHFKDIPAEKVQEIRFLTPEEKNQILLIHLKITSPGMTFKPDSRGSRVRECL